MHELGLSEQIVALACDAARREGAGVRVSRVVVEVGRLAGVLPEALAACFPLCAEGTEAEGAALELRPVAGRGRCRACGAEVAMERPYAVCACGGSDLDWLSGEELRIKELEVVPCA